MTDKEIIQALACCQEVNVCGCNCPRTYYCLDDKSECITELITDALDLINRQQAEIDELKHEREILIEDIHHSADQINEQLEEIEKLNVELVGMRGACNSYKMHYDNAQAEIERSSNSAKRWEDTAKDLLISKEKQQAEIERLQKHIQENLQKHIQKGIDLGKQLPEMIANAKAEAIKEFLNKAKKQSEIIYGDRAVCVEVLDDVYKEMVGEQGW